jgi:hypothetical protein
MSPPEHRLAELLATGADQLPRPGGGRTRERWQALADVAAEDVALAKLFEGHTDARAILDELGGAPPPAGSVWGTWAAEPPFARVELSEGPEGVHLNGRKAWCSGSDVVSHALLTAWNSAGQQCLVAVSMLAPGVQATKDGWHAVGMGRAASGDVLFQDTPAVLVGEPGSYLERPGFWQGGGGIAACWYGGALPLAAAVADQVAKRDDPHAAAHLGAIDVTLRSTRALLIEAATWIDEHPQASAQRVAGQVRAAAETTVGLVLDRAGRALGAGPLCRDESIAQRFADLPVFVRQSHAERDLAALGRQICGGTDNGWRL